MLRPKIYFVFVNVIYDQSKKQTFWCKQRLSRLKGVSRFAEVNPFCISVKTLLNAVFINWVIVIPHICHFLHRKFFLHIKCAICTHSLPKCTCFAFNMKCLHITDFPPRTLSEAATNMRSFSWTVSLTSMDYFEYLDNL